ncbi:MAG: Type IV secretory pathway VirB4 component-like protein [Candidatus Gottesmanbacteria bacterium GW2011_GWA2_42_18]|uniref:Type IV secretory pathway VirB4 component-like protein n=1 Tax=Candidatus Gottesmanbacteria bacterium GW2011_GWA2_42_18 TaxID=1618442 RepID=A0A0G0ZDP8_9BACT|nr:MAG: Type IV secretory pathway VirB4 component-like protein [Candidatus Gottesmanbacteria bacterium GW2011_GWA2_42_18]KKS76428.1 MAG: Type IV secretory pathway VirB4 component-like protein [Candidatus Gottesmanbacteria bacterium GW2011_GWC2_42_8]
MSLFSKKKAPVSILPKPVAAVQPLQPVQPGVKPNLQTVGQPVQPVISHAVVNNRAANTAKSNQLLEAKQKLTKGLVNIRDIIAPSLVEVDFDNIRVNNTFYRTLFVAGYPRYVASNWLHPLLSFDKSLFISMYIYPAESKVILEDLKRKIAEMEATIQVDMKRGKVIDPSVQVSLDDALALQSQLAKGAERFYQFSLYVSIPADTIEELNRSSKEVESTLGSLLIVPKHATLSQEDGFKSTLPMSLDKLDITRNMDTTSLATTFPFTTASLTANEGILYGINEHDGSLVIFNRFSLENSNSVIFGKSGSGKSFLVKLEVMRTLMFGTDVFVIDPEGEYTDITKTLGGDQLDFSFNSPVKINPFDLSGIVSEGENELGLKILSLHGLMRVIMGELNPTEDALLDKALVSTYKQKGITPDPETQKREPPLMEDLYKVLLGMEEENARRLAERLEKFVKGSLAGIFNQQSNLHLKNALTVFNIKELEAELRPMAIFSILDFIWTKIKREVKKRILVVDEAWYLMKHPDSATFLYSIAKRARKYYLGVTTITQDVEDFLSTDHGKAIITNSSLQVLLKQSTAAIDKLAEVFYLSSGEKHFLLSAGVGEGLFFAGASHAAVQFIASAQEYQLATSKPGEMKQEKPLPANMPQIQSV